jgi:integrase
VKRPKNKLPRGIFIRKDRGTDWYWIRYFDQHGRKHREKASPLLEGAKATLEKRRIEIREGKFFPGKVKQRSVLFREIAQEYLAKVRQGRKRDKAHDEQRVPVLVDVLKDTPVDELTPGRLDSVLDGLAGKNEWTRSTQNRYRSLLSGIFRQAIREARINFNPVRETTHYKENKRVRYLREDEDEEARLIKVVRSQSPEREAEILVALHSPMRRSEQYRTCQVSDGGLKWEYINFRAGVIRLPRSKAGEEPREIPMNSVLRETLRSIPQKIDSPYVFNGTDPERWFSKLVKAAGIKDFTWHDLRHTFASRLAMEGVSMRHTADLMGHSEIQTTMRYAHLVSCPSGS